MAAHRFLTQLRLLVGLTLFPLLIAAVGPACAQAPVPAVRDTVAVSGGIVQPPLAYDEAEAQDIDGMLMCPVCPAETIDQAQVPLARQMRQMVRDMLAEGATRQEILDFFAERYGQAVIAAPPKSGFNLMAWVFPVAAVFMALLAGFFVLRSMTRPSRPDYGPSGPPGEADGGPHSQGEE